MKKVVLFNTNNEITKIKFVYEYNKHRLRSGFIQELLYESELEKLSKLHQNKMNYTILSRSLLKTTYLVELIIDFKDIKSLATKKN